VKARQGRPGCVLVGSASFWEGVDVPGEALQLVVIDKLPFPPPNDPLVEARTRRLGGEGRSPFRLLCTRGGGGAQAGGRAADPRESDQGVLVVCDTRLARWATAPAAGGAAADARLGSAKRNLMAALDQLAATRTSTTGSAP
jgi:ATP-dependent DNA helicase DinG